PGHALRAPSGPHRARALRARPTGRNARAARCARPQDGGSPGGGIWRAVVPPRRRARGHTAALEALLPHAIASLDGPDAAREGLLQDAFPNGRHHEAEKPTLEVLAVTDNDQVDVGRAVRTPRETVGVARIASPGVRVCSLEDDVGGIG